MLRERPGSIKMGVDMEKFLGERFLSGRCGVEDDLGDRIHVRSRRVGGLERAEILLTLVTPKVP